MADNRLSMILLCSLYILLFLIGLSCGMRYFEKYLVTNFFISRTYLIGYNGFYTFLGFALSFLLFVATCLLMRINLYLGLIPLIVLCYNAFRLGAITMVMIAAYGLSGILCLSLVYYPIYIALFSVMTKLIIETYNASCGFNWLFDFQPAALLVHCVAAGKKYLWLLGMLLAYFVIVF